MGAIPRLEAGRTVLAIIDMQEAFRPIIADFTEVATRIGKAVQGARLLKLPVLITEQYPKGLQRTADEIASHLDPASHPIEKLTFSSCGVQEFSETLRRHGARKILMCGIEAHICVTQTALDLLSEGYEVHLLEDCITSRNPDSKRIALERLTRAGAVPSNLEMALFELMGTSAAPAFRDVQNLIR